MAGKIHIVKQGEYLAKIAKNYGFNNWRTIYEHPDNVEFRKKRSNPNIIYPGDRLVIPDKISKEESEQTEQRHKFQLKVEGLLLRIVIKDLDDQPLAKIAYKLKVDDLTFEGMTNNEGLIEHKIPVSVDSGVLYINEWALPLKIGHLDPIEEVTGWQARLDNLGYYGGPIDGKINNDDGKPRPFLKFAIEEFQLDNKLKVDGVMGRETTNKLKQVHGC